MTDLCADCGLCCKRLLIYILESDLRREPKLRPHCHPVDGIEPEQEYQLAKPGKPCGLLRDNRCMVHETKPTCCRDFEVGGEHCNELREEHGLDPIL